MDSFGRGRIGFETLLESELSMRWNDRIKRIMSKTSVMTVGQRFREMDKRFYRIVEVVKVKKNRVQIKTLTKLPHNVTLTIKKGRTTWARKDRFFKRSGGYYPLYGFCHECQLERGGKIPEHGHVGITISMGTCSKCLARDVGLVPSCDYDWPKKGVRAVWD